MATADGKVVIDTQLNNKGFKSGVAGLKNQLNGLAGVVGKLGKLLAGVFAVKGLVKFGKEAIELGSNIAEVQNVVDVAFGDMSGKMEDFAKTAVKSFGMSQLAAKKTGSAYMAMAKGMGIADAAASDMAINLTALSGDVASFYNITQEEADAKLRSVFTGVTQPMKDLGVVMTQTNLQAFALKKGITTSVEKMDQASLVALRYEYVMEQLALAHGDFARTSDSWANQTRILSEQWKEFMSIIGQALITVLSPLVKILNQIVSSLISVANAFNAAITSIFGGAQAQIQQTEAAAAGVAGAIADAADNQDDLTGATKKTNKEQKKSLANFDEIHKLTDNKSDSSGGGAGGGYTPSAFETMVSPGVDESAVDKAEGALQKIIDKAKELAAIFAEGFQVGWGDTDFSGITDSIAGIKDSLVNVFIDPDVQASAAQYVDTMIYTLGEVTGSVASMGVTIASTLLGGINKYLSDNSGRVKEWITRMFDARSEMGSLIGKFSTAFADVFSVFNGENGQTIVANAIQIFTDVFGGAQLLAASWATDVLDCLTTPFVENADAIKVALEGLLEPVASVTSTIAGVVRELVDGIISLYDEHLSPLFDTIRDIWTVWVGNIVDGFNTYIKPVLDEFASKFSEVVEQYVKPMIDSAVEFFGKWIDKIREFWETWLQPLVSWLIGVLSPVVAGLIGYIGGLINGFITFISSFVKGIFDIFSGLMDFFSGDFSGGLSKIWEGITGIFSGAWDAVKTVFSGAGTYFKNIVQAIKNAFGGIADWFKGIFSNAWQKVKDVFSKGGKIFDGIKDGILNGLKAVINGIIDGINKVIKVPFDGLNSALRSIRNVEIVGLRPFGWIKEISVPQIPRLAQGAVIPPNREFLAVLGDQKSGTNIETPLSTMVQAFKQAMAEGGYNGQNITLVVRPEAGFTRYMKFELDEETARQGVRLVQGV